MSEASKIKFPVLATLILAGTFILGSAAGMFMYATGEEVLGSTFMQMISHTEYRYSEPGQIIARLVDFKGDPVSVLNCTTDIKYPDKTAFVTSALMSTSTITGDHYYNFTTPVGPEGVYEYQATCFYTQGVVTRNTSVTNSFHLSSAFTNVLSNLTQVQTDIANLDLDLQNINGSLYDAIANVNTTLAQDISDLSNQLNVNVTTILDAIISSSGNVNFTEVLTAISGNTTYLYDALSEDVLYSDEFSGGINSSWDVIDGTVVASLVGYNNNGATYGMNLSNGAVNLTDPRYSVLSWEEKFVDVTYEMVTDAETESSFFFDYENLQFVFSTSNSLSTISMAYDNLNPSYGAEVALQDAGFHVMQLHFSDYNGSSVLATGYVDGVMVGSVRVAQVDLKEFVITGYSGSIVDNVLIYEGSPESRGLKEEQIRSAITVMQASIDTLSTNINNNFTVVNTNIQEINVTVTDIQSTVDAMELVLNNVNATTTNTYNYVTGTLATNVNSILSTLGVINATVNRIETNTLNINATTNTILDNQENEIHMTVFSG